MIKIPKNFDGSVFAEKHGLGMFDFSVKHGGLICPSLPELTDADLADCVVVYQYKIRVPSFPVAIGADAEVFVYGSPNETVTVLIDDGEMDVILDETGTKKEIIVSDTAGEYVVKFLDQALSVDREVIKVVA